LLERIPGSIDGIFGSHFIPRCADCLELENLAPEPHQFFDNLSQLICIPKIIANDKVMKRES
jgi:hypothetical protein